MLVHCAWTNVIRYNIWLTNEVNAEINFNFNKYRSIVHYLIVNKYTLFVKYNQII